MNSNLVAQMWLTARFLPHFLERKNSLIINVTSELAVEPNPSCAGYSASKAAFHAFHKALYSQMLDTQVVVVEILPPAVVDSTSMEAFADHVMQRLIVGDLEISLPGDGAKGGVHKDVQDEAMLNKKA
eukprot:gene39205-48421_t